MAFALYSPTMKQNSATRSKWSTHTTDRGERAASHTMALATAQSVLGTLVLT